MKYKTYKPNSNNKPAADKRKAAVRISALNLAEIMKPHQSQIDVIIAIKEKFGLSTHDARAIYREAAK